MKCAEGFPGKAVLIAGDNDPLVTYHHPLPAITDHVIQMLAGLRSHRLLHHVDTLIEGWFTEHIPEHDLIFAKMVGDDLGYQH